jgi:hypothetical protein
MIHAFFVYAQGVLDDLLESRFINTIENKKLGFIFVKLCVVDEQVCLNL